MLTGKKWIKGVVTSVGDSDNFRLYHTPGIFFNWPLKIRWVPTDTKGKRLHILALLPLLHTQIIAWLTGFLCRRLAFPPPRPRPPPFSSAQRDNPHPHSGCRRSRSRSLWSSCASSVGRVARVSEEEGRRQEGQGAPELEGPVRADRESSSLLSVSSVFMLLTRVCSSGDRLVSRSSLAASSLSSPPKSSPSRCSATDSARSTPPPVQSTRTLGSISSRLPRQKQGRYPPRYVLRSRTRR